MSNKSFIFCCVVALLCLFAIANAQFSTRALQDEIVDLPDAPKYSKMFSGYIDIANNTHHLFYWFITAKNDPDATNPNTPLAWTSNGGPGCSGLLGMMTEWGPLQPVPDGKGSVKLVERKHTWNENFHMLYVEQPQVGFTWFETGTEPTMWTNDLIATRNAEFIANFFDRFPNLKVNPFMINSESMGGVYIPVIARELIKQKKAGGKLGFLNFQYALVGNPLLYLPWLDYAGYATYINQKFIPYYPLGEEYLKKCTPDPKNHPYPAPSRDSACDKLEREMDQYTHATDPYALGFPVCVDPSTGKLKSSSPYLFNFALERSRAQRAWGKKHTALDSLNAREQFFDELLSRAEQETDKTYEELLNQILRKGDVAKPDNGDDYFPERYQACEEDYTVTYMNRADVKKAIHATLKKSKWDYCSSCRYSNIDMSTSVIEVYEDNHKQMPSLKQVIFSGSHDTVCATPSDDLALQSYQLQSTKPITIAGQAAALERKYDVLTHYTVFFGGHMIPSTRPQQSKTLAEHIVLGKPLP
eukprot:UN00146